MVGSYLQLIRWPNVLMVGLTQLMCYFKFIYPLQITEDTLCLSIMDQMLLILCTMSITAAGFVINDLHDVESDLLNNKRNLISLIGKPNSRIFYFALIFIGLILSLYLAMKLDFHFSWLLFPLSHLMLWWYSRYGKCSILIGNSLVSTFIGASILLPIYANKNQLISALYLSMDQTEFLRWVQELGLWCSFAVLSNFFREIVKDIEDKDGDKACNCVTTAVYFSIRTCKLILITVLLTIAFIAIVNASIAASTLQTVFYFVCIILPILGLGWLLLKAKESKEWAQISLYSKLYMALGLCFLFFI